MTAPLRRAVLRRPGPAFGRAYDEPAHGFRQPAQLDLALRQHAELAELLAGLGVDVELLEEDGLGPDATYVFDPLLVTDRGTVALRSGKPTRRGEEASLERWAEARDIPSLGRITAPGTVDGGDTFWLRPDLLCVGRSLRTNRAGAAQLAALVGGHVQTFDMSWWRGPGEVLHLLSVISPLADDLAVVYRPLLPASLAELLQELQVRTLDVEDDEFETLGSNVLAVRPGVVVLAAGNRRISRQMTSAGCEVHTFQADEIGLNGSGGPTCLVRPILRDTA